MTRITRDVSSAAAVVRQGGILAYPTEAIYGLGCDPHNELAVHRLLHIKHRKMDKGLILIAAEFQQLAPFLRPVDVKLSSRAMETWPGPVTWLWPCRPDAPRWITGRHKTLAVRVTDHPLAAQLCREAGFALVSTSANRSGETPCRTSESVEDALGPVLDMILDGETGGRDQPSQIRDLVTGTIVRH